LSRGRRGEFSSEEREQLEKLNNEVKDFPDGERFRPLVDSINAENEKRKRRDREDQEEAEREARLSSADTYVLMNGDPFAPGELVTPGYLSAVKSWSDELEQQLSECADSVTGRRTALADWIASPQNPLTMRVYVNRVWQYHFGAGIVRTPNDFGENGAGASHPELLDFLAAEFVAGGERTKPLHRLIVLSRTYRASSRHPEWAQCATADPDNRLLWRAPLRRLEAEVVRDSLLAVSGRLNTQRGGPGFYEQLPDGMPTEYPFFKWNASEDNQRRRRSIYMFQRRNLVHPLMEAFDVADANQSCERRSQSVTASQALSLINGGLAAEASLQLVRRIQAETEADPAAHIGRAYALVLCREPAEDELAECEQFLQGKALRYAAAAAGQEPATLAPEALALRDLCLVLLNSNEFLYVD
jgi:hypothetical protein